MMRVALVLCLVSAGLCGCKSSRPQVAAAPGGNLPDGDGSVPDYADGGMDPLAPTVQISAPKAASSPNDDTVVTDLNVTVHCQVTRSAMSGSQAVDKSKVVISLDKPDDTTKSITPTTNALSDTEFTAAFDMGALPNGPLHFHCQAQDQATRPRIGMASLNTLLDLGPTVDVSAPKDKGIYTLKSPVAIEFQVDASALGDADDEKAIKTVTLTVSGVDVPIQESSDKPGLYQTSIDFDDREKYPTPPSSAHIVVAATNSRTPTAATRSATADITIDGDGPTIKIENPINQDIVHGNIALRINVSDPSGIMPGSLVADINGMRITDWNGTAPEFSQTFDTRMFGAALTQLTVNVTASDAVGNESTAPALYKLDNVAPIISLDPPMIRELKMDVNSYYCSELFDPVGDSAANDLQTIETSHRFRALIEDRTNHSNGASTDYLAGTDPSSVVLYVQPNNSVPLLVDTDHDKDHACDEINDKMLQDPLQRPKQQPLAPVTPTGQAYFIGQNHATDMPVGCNYEPESNEDPPKPVCAHTEMFRVVPARVQGKPPGIFAMLPTNGSDGECDGTSWEVGGFLGKEGWFCAAARAEDLIKGGGNIGISAPLRLCYDDGVMANGTPDCDPNHAPTCTDGCVITDSQKYPSGMIWAVQ
jgi:hypothetical protein